MIRTVKVCFGNYMAIVMDFGESTRRRKSRLSYLSKFHSKFNGALDRIALRDAPKLALLCKEALGQRKQLHIVVEKVLHCIKCMERCPDIKGVILPLSAISALLSHYGSNIDRIRCYARRLRSRNSLAKKVFGWAIVVFLISAIIHALIGGGFFLRYKTPPYIYKLLYRTRCQLSTAEFQGDFNKRFVSSQIVEEKDSFWRADPTILSAEPLRQYDPLYRTNIIIMALFCAVFITILLIVAVIKAINVVVSRTYVKVADIAVMEEEYVIYKKFFDVLQSADAQNSLLDVEKSVNNSSEHLLKAELERNLDSNEEYTIYGSNFFRYDEQVAGLLIRLKWTKLPSIKIAI